MPSEGVDCYRYVIDHIEVWSLQWNKTGFFPSCGCVNTTVCMHHMDADKIHREKARLELLKNATCCFEQTLEATSHKTASHKPSK